MFHSILTGLTTTAVTLHALLGCCAHHVHVGDTLGHEAAQVADDDHDGHGHKHHAHCEDRSTARGDHQHPANGEPCDEPECSFVAVQRCDDVIQNLSLANWLAAPGDTFAPLELHGCLSIQTGIAGFASHSLPPEPLRALTQVWLI